MEKSLVGQNKSNLIKQKQRPHAEAKEKKYLFSTFHQQWPTSWEADVGRQAL